MVDGEYSLIDTYDGVRLTQNANIQWKFPMNIISLIFGSKIRQNIITRSQNELNKLKELSEGTAINK
jgi:hypothetical protein